LKINATVIVGILFALIAFAALAVISTQHPFPEFKYSTQSDHMVNVTQNIGVEDSRFMWDNDGLNLITQAFALFAAAAATLAILSRDAEEETERSTLLPI
jgi:hypothetical protein